MEKIIPSILTKTVEDAIIQMQSVEGIASLVQIDIMDGKFTDVTSFSLDELIDVSTPLRLEVHLMVLHPEKYFSICEQLGAERVFFHIEAVRNVDMIKEELQKYSFTPGIALQHDTGIEMINDWYPDIKDILMLSIANPGHQGMEFQEKELKDFAEIKQHFPSCVLEVDGGVKLNNIQKMVDVGVDQFCVGSALMKSNNIKEIFEEFTRSV